MHFLPVLLIPSPTGHVDLIRRSASMVTSLVVAVAINPSKNPFFSLDERVELLHAVCREWPHVEIGEFRGLVVDAARDTGADAIIRGIRSGADYEHEMQMAQVNRALTGVETLLLPASPQWTFLSSSLIKEVARFGGDITPFVPGIVAERVRARLCSSK